MTHTETRAATPQAATSKRPAILEALRRAAPHGLRVAEIATHAGCSHITVRRHVDSLREEGLVVRVLEGQPRPVRSDGTRRPGMGYYEYRVKSGRPTT